MSDEFAAAAAAAQARLESGPGPLLAYEQALRGALDEVTQELAFHVAARPELLRGGAERVTALGQEYGRRAALLEQRAAQLAAHGRSLAASLGQDAESNEYSAIKQALAEEEQRRVDPLVEELRARGVELQEARECFRDALVTGAAVVRGVLQDMVTARGGANSLERASGSLRREPGTAVSLDRSA